MAQINEYGWSENAMKVRQAIKNFNEDKEMNQDKLGKYHSCNRETYRKLKKFKFFYHVGRIQHFRHLRWASKLPHNRVKWQRVLTPDAMKLGDKVLLFKNASWVSTIWEEPERCPINLSVLEHDYKNARIGHDDPSKVVAMKLDEAGLDAMIEQLYAWTDRCYGKRR